MNKKIIGIAIGLCLFGIMFYLVIGGHNQGFDDSIRFCIYDLRTPALTVFAKVVTYLSAPVTIIVFCAVLVLLPMTRKYYGYPVAAGAIAITIVNKSIKHTVLRDRPDEIFRLVSETGYSFPSGHSITSMFVFGILVYLVNKHVENRQVRTVLMILCAILVVTVGPSRVYLGVHYPTDVLAGWGLGIAAIGVTMIILEYIEKRGTINGSN